MYNICIIFVSKLGPRSSFPKWADHFCIKIRMSPNTLFCHKILRFAPHPRGNLPIRNRQDLKARTLWRWRRPEAGRPWPSLRSCTVSHGPTPSFSPGRPPPTRTTLFREVIESSRRVPPRRGARGWPDELAGCSDQLPPRQSPVSSS